MTIFQNLSKCIIAEIISCENVPTTKSPVLPKKEQSLTEGFEFSVSKLGTNTTFLSKNKAFL